MASPVADKVFPAAVPEAPAVVVPAVLVEDAVALEAPVVLAVRAARTDKVAPSPVRR